MERFHASFKVFIVFQAPMLRFEKHEYVTRLVDSILRMKLNHLLCDVTLVVDDGDVFAHSVILAAVSPFLCNTFVQLACSSDVTAQLLYSIDLHGFKVAEVDAALHYLYTGTMKRGCSAKHEDNDTKLTQSIVNILESLGVDVQLYTKSDEVVCYEGGNNDVAVEKTLENSALSRDSQPVPAAVDGSQSIHVVIELQNPSSCQSSFPVGSDVVVVGASEFRTVQDAAAGTISRTQNVLLTDVDGSFTSATGHSVVDSQQSNSTCSSFGRAAAAKSSQTSSAHRRINSPCRSVRCCDVITGSDRRKKSRKAVKRKVCLCRLCGRTLSSVKLLRRHEQTHVRLDGGGEGGELVQHTCKLCDKNFKSVSGVRAHQLTVHYNGGSGGGGGGGRRKPYLCEECGRCFLASTGLRRHVMLRHTNRRPFICERCGKGFVARARLVRHAEIHDPLSRDRYACAECGLKFANAGNLVRHRLKHSTDPHPYACKLCNRKFTQKTSLDAHTASQHDPEARKRMECTCTVCGKTLSKASNLVRHMQLHRPLPSSLVQLQPSEVPFISAHASNSQMFMPIVH